MTFTVTRQHRWDDGIYLVEVTNEGFGYSNPDCLYKRYDGEMEEFNSLVEATETAIKIAELWQQDKPTEKIFIAGGCTYGMTAHFDEMELTEETFASLRKHAERIDARLPKCCECGTILGDKRDRFRVLDVFDEEFCSSYCAEKRYQEMIEVCDD